MKQWVAKLGQGMARLAVWRKRGAEAADAESSPTPAVDPVPAPVAVAAPVAPVPAAPSPVIAADELADGLAELGDPSAPQANSIDSLFTDGLAELDALSDPEPLLADDTLAVQPAPPTPNKPAPVAAAAKAIEATAPPPGRHESAPADEAAADLPPVSRVKRLIRGIRLLASRVRQIKLKGLGLKGLVLKGLSLKRSALKESALNESALGESVLTEPALKKSALKEAAPEEPALAGSAPRLIGILSKKRVWIPSISLALLAVIGSLTFMLVKASSEKAHLQADLTAAKKALKQAGAKTSVAVIPPLLAGSMPPADAHPEHASPTEVAAPTQLAAAELSIEPLRMERTSSPGEPVQMDCDVSSKASVAQNLKKCIEAFNQASGH